MNYMGIEGIEYINVFTAFEEYIKFYCDKHFWKRRRSPETTIHNLPVVYWYELDHTIIDQYQVFYAYLETTRKFDIDLEIALIDWQYEIVGKGHLKDIF